MRGRKEESEGETPGLLYPIAFETVKETPLQDGGTTPLLSLSLPGLGGSFSVIKCLATKSDVSVPW